MNDLKERTKRFALDVIVFCGKLTLPPELMELKRQLVKAATSVGANYRAAQRAPSTRSFVAKLNIVEEEADESQYWLELLEMCGFAAMPDLQRLKREAGELAAIMIASKKTSRQNSWRRTA